MPTSENKPRLLAIEDDTLLAQLIGTVAQDAGFAVAIASGERGADTYMNFSPDVIVLDILMPTVDGFEILRFLKTCHSRSRIILLSGDENYRKMAESIAGDELIIEANLAKPFDIPALHERFSALRRAIAGDASSAA